MKTYQIEIYKRLKETRQNIVPWGADDNLMTEEWQSVTESSCEHKKSEGFKKQTLRVF